MIWFLIFIAFRDRTRMHLNFVILFAPTFLIFRFWDDATFLHRYKSWWKFLERKLLWIETCFQQIVSRLWASDRSCWLHECARNVLQFSNEWINVFFRDKINNKSFSFLLDFFKFKRLSLTQKTKWRVDFIDGKHLII